MFNTLKYARILESTGVSREQAEAHVQIIAEVVGDNLATKEDIRSTKEDIKSTKDEIRNTKEDIRKEIKDLENHIDHKMLQLEYRMIIKLGTIVTIVLGAMTAVIKVF